MTLTIKPLPFMTIIVGLLVGLLALLVNDHQDRQRKSDTTSSRRMTNADGSKHPRTIYSQPAPAPDSPFSDKFSAAQAAGDQRAKDAAHKAEARARKEFNHGN